MWLNNCFGRHFLTYFQNAWTYFNETYHIYSVPGPHDAVDIFKVMGSKVKVTTFSENALSSGRQFAIEDHLVPLLC